MFKDPTHKYTKIKSYKTCKTKEKNRLASGQCADSSKHHHKRLFLLFLLLNTTKRLLRMKYKKRIHFNIGDKTRHGH